jgi:hypothetical protein
MYNVQQYVYVNCSLLKILHFTPSVIILYLCVPGTVVQAHTRASSILVCVLIFWSSLLLLYCCPHVM